MIFGSTHRGSRPGRYAIACGFAALLLTSPPPPARAQEPKPPARKSAEPAKPGDLPVLEVSQPIVRMIDDFEVYDGYIVAAKSIQVTSRVSGAIRQVFVAPGQIVKQGDVLFEVDNRPFMIAVEKAQAEVLHAEALRDQAAIELKQAIENLKRNVVAADAVSFSQNALRAAEAEVRSAKASLDMARLDLEWTKIVAPIDGVLGDFSTIPGSAVAENDTVLTSLTDPSRLNVTFHVGEGSIHAIRKRRGAVALRVEVATAGDDSPIKGRVTYAGSSLDPKTRTCLIRAELENPDRSVMPGMSARVYLFTGERHEAILVNQNAVTFGNTSTIIYTCGEDKRIVPEAITVVVTRAGLVEITSRFDRSSWVVVEAGRDGSAYKLTLYLMGPGKPFERREVAMPEPKPKP